MISGLSKSDYLLGIQCAKALWYSRYRQDIPLDEDEQVEKRKESGVLIGKLSKSLYPGGKEVSLAGGILEAERSTRELIDQGQPIIFEATLQDPETNAYARADIIWRAEGDDVWHMIEVKSSTGVEDYHIEDMAFQSFVFGKSGLDVRTCVVLHINSEYVREGKVDPNALFVEEEVSDEVLARQESLGIKIDDLRELLQKDKEEPDIEIGPQCKKPFSCGYASHCWKHVPEYSVFNVFQTKKAAAKAKKYGLLVKDLPPEEYPSGSKKVDIEAHLTGEVQLDKINLRSFVDQLQFPLYFLDYETINPAIPLFDHSRPYQQIPFQFSLHIQDEPGGKVSHHEFLHKKRTDPRVPFLEALVQHCGDEGSVIVYNQSFEKSRNKELARDFPEYAKQILGINERIIDLMIPFRKRWLYHPNQNGSYGIKAVLPSFTDITYEGLPIAKGSQAMALYEEFIHDELEDQDLGKLWAGLKEYCKLDTWALKVLLDEIFERLL